MKKTKSYDQLNNYDFIIRYFMKIGIDTDYEECIEITKKIFEELNDKGKLLQESKIEIFKKYYVGFYKDETSYVTQEVVKEVYECLKKTQDYERNKVKHERERHIDTYFNQNRIKYIPSGEDYEEIILDIINENEIKRYLDTILNKKQSRRFFKHKIKDIPLVAIANEERTDAGSISKSVIRAKKKILKNLKIF